MFDEIEVRIISLLRKNTYISGNEIAKELNISTKTVQRKIKNINDILTSSNVKINVKHSVGYYLKKEDKEKLNKIFVKQKMTAESDDSIILKKLILNSIFGKRIKVCDLAYSCYLSESKARRLLTQLTDKGIKLDYKNGLIIKSDWQNILNLIDKNFGSLYLFFEHIDNNEIDTLKNIIISKLAIHQIVITDNSLHQILLALIIDPMYLDRLQLNVNQALYDVSLDILKSVYSNIDSLRLNNITNILGLARREKADDEYMQIIHSLLIKVDDKFCLDFADDYELLKNITIHIKAMLLRCNCHMSVSDNYTDLVINSLPIFMDAAIYLTELIENTFDLEGKIPDAEKALLAIYLGGSFKRMLNENKNKVKIGIICGSGYGVSSFIKQQLLENFSNRIEIVGCYSLYQIENEILSEKIDLFLSTVNDNIDDKTVKKIINITPFLTTMDINKIDCELNKIICNFEYLLYSLIEKDLIINLDSCSSKTQMLEIGLKKLKDKGVLDDLGIKSIYDREKLGSCEVGDGICIPHPLNAEINKPRLCFIKSKHNVQGELTNINLMIIIAIDFKKMNNASLFVESLINLARRLVKVEKISYELIIKE